MNIYADNAATTKLSNRAKQVMLGLLDEVYANPSSLHSPGQRASEVLEEARSRIADYIGCEPRELIFTSGGSESDNQAILSAAVYGQKKNKKHIISTAFEHHAVLNTLKQLEKQGFEVTLLDVHSNGIVTADEVAAAIRPDTCLVSVMYANNEIGTLQPISEIGAVCREKGVIFHTDAVQAVGHIPINVNDEHIDMLSLSAHKFNGPKGIGALYVRKGIPAASLIHGGAQERGRRAGTENIPAIAAMAEALCEACEEMTANSERLLAFRRRLIEALSAIPHSVLNGDPELRLPGNVSFCFEGIEGEALLLLLDDKGVYASSGSACTSGDLDPSHVLLAIGHPHEIAHGSLRLTLSPENTDEEVEYIIDAVTEVVAKLRSISPVWRDLNEGRKEFIIK